MNAIRIAALSVLLCASAALAQSKKEQPPKLPKPVLTAKDMPKSCDQQCDMVEKLASHSCVEKAGTNQAAKQKCGKPFAQMTKACKDSCRDKGHIDRQYMMERMKPPPGVKLPKEESKSKKGSKSEGEEHAD